MKKALSLIACAAVLFTACSKDSSDPTPVPTPAKTGSGNFTFSMDASYYTIDTLQLTYKGGDGVVKTQNIYNQNSWSSPTIVFNTGDSIRADVRAVGSMKNAPDLDTVPGAGFKVTSPDASTPGIKGAGGQAKTVGVNGIRFVHTSYTSRTF